MRNLNHKYVLYAIGLFLLASVIGLWSWNTLAEPFKLPPAEHKHVIAALFLLATLKWFLLPGHRNSGRPVHGQHEQGNA